jgi:hypothetical protein
VYSTRAQLCTEHAPWHNKTSVFLKQNQYKHMMSACPSDLNVSGENSIARGSCSESEPVGKEDFSPAGSKTDGAEPLKREVPVLLGRCVAFDGSYATDVS